ncbi:hypothetical protein [Candidatus Merdisoma sp. JLR.KK006]
MMIQKTELLYAMARATKCMGERCPVRFELDGNYLSLVKMA